MNIFRHTGDIGDCIAALPAICALGGGGIVITPPNGGRQGRESMAGSRFDALRHLLLAQPYVKWAKWQDEPKKITHDFANFRHGEIQGESLAHWQARHLGVAVFPEDPWLTCIRSPKSLGRVVVARSSRYHNENFQWHSVLRKHPDALFVGLPDEHAALESYTQLKVEYCPTHNLLDAAEIIAGAEMFVGNQSSPLWIALGLGVKTVVESFVWSHNSRIDRRNTFYGETHEEQSVQRRLFL